MTAAEIDTLLRAKHAKDLWVSECKDGPTQAASHRRLDGWAMSRSWAHWTTYGYEIKVSRSDFLGDTKYVDYLPLCHKFYFAAPRGMIARSEVPAGIGLVEASGSKLLTRVPAQHRKIDPPVDLLVYVLMCRATIDAPHPPTTIDEWRAWLAQREEEREIGYQVSRSLRAAYEREVLKVREENDRLARRVDEADRILAVARAAGLTDRWLTPKEVLRRGQRWIAGISAELDGASQGMRMALDRLDKVLSAQVEDEPARAAGKEGR